MTWSHRVYHLNGVYTVREHYEDDQSKCVGFSGPQQPIAFSEDPDQPLDQLRWQLNQMLKALDKPILEDVGSPVTIKITQDDLLEAFGRAYCTTKNRHKMVDLVLGLALCDELFGVEKDDTET